jgi:hypothetical protein
MDYDDYIDDNVDDLVNEIELGEIDEDGFRIQLNRLIRRYQHFIDENEYLRKKVRKLLKKYRGDWCDCDCEDDICEDDSDSD